MRLKNSRKLFFIRHGERIDNIMPEWRRTAAHWDDPYLSNRGHVQAREVGAHFGALKDSIDHVFSSPFTRCIQTTNGVMSGLPNIPRLHIEPGLGESLNACASPPGRPSIDEIRQLTPFDVDMEYSAVFSALPPEYGGDEGCIDRVGHTLRTILQKYPKGNLAFVSHGSPLAAAHIALFGSWNYVGQCTIGEVVDREGAYELVRWGDSSHLSDRSQLRAVQSKKMNVETRSPIAQP